MSDFPVEIGTLEAHNRTHADGLRDQREHLAALYEAVAQTAPTSEQRERAAKSARHFRWMAEFYG